ncbi:MAG: septum site-determining protein MinC [Lachnospiraceae bacterium]
MSSIVKIKSYPNGIRVQMDSQCSFEEIAEGVEMKFRESRKFFGNKSVAISFEGRFLSFEEEDILCDIISENTDMEIICVIEPDEDVDNFFQSAIRNMRDEFERNDICFYKKSIINEEIIDCKKDVVIIGDVNPGCTVVSDGSIFVFGGLYGAAFAGVSDTEDEISDKVILAMEMAPEELKIGSMFYEPVKKNKWGIRAKIIPQVAYASNDKINIEPYTKELLDRVLN